MPAFEPGSPVKVVQNKKEEGATPPSDNAQKPKRGRRLTELKMYVRESEEQIKIWKTELKEAIIEQKKNSKERKGFRLQIKDQESLI